jgi:hypothetical protein
VKSPRKDSLGYYGFKHQTEENIKQNEFNTGIVNVRWIVGIEKVCVWSIETLMLKIVNKLFILLIVM